jgi:peptidyl-tRNA hydrolase, PTH1 family
MKLIVGLGNPGLAYRATRHNVGFMVVEALAAERGIRISRRAFRGRLGEGTIGKEQVILLEPQTFMNLSGESVGAAARFHHIPLENILVICDDLNLPVGKLRVRRSGSDGGHNGLTSVIQHLSSKEFARLRVGIDQPPPGLDSVKYVTGKFSKTERPAIEEAIVRAVECALTWVYYGAEETMNRYNG